MEGNAIASGVAGVIDMSRVNDLTDVLTEMFLGVSVRSISETWGFWGVVGVRGVSAAKKLVGVGVTGASIGEDSVKAAK